MTYTSDVTGRGFRIDRFTDEDGVACSLQESSRAGDGESFVWLGCDDIGLKRFTPDRGWEDVSTPSGGVVEVMHIANTRMLLSQSHVRQILPALQHFAETGALPGD